jgi:penicillin amidase
MVTAVSPTSGLILSPRRGRRIVAWIAGAVLSMVLAVLGWAFWMAQSALPQMDGQIEVRGLSAPVNVRRDGHGVPTIEAANLDDLFFAQGYVTAQDRLWQMDAMRRFAAGELAEVLGEDLLPRDRAQRILGLRVAARKNLEVSSPECRAHFEAYARGVNTFIETHRKRPAVEFRILGYQPRPWTPEDSALIAAQMVEDLTHYSYRSTLTREKILAKLGPELTADLYVNSSEHDRPPTVERGSVLKPANDDEDDEDDDEGPANSMTRNSAPVKFPDYVDEPQLAGSNDWVVSGEHTVSGKPLLSNDMHLGHQMPNLWYEAHLKSGVLDVVGVTLPGMPYVIVGHNQRVAWGFTNVGGTVEDAYVERFNASGQYLTPAGWKEAEHRKETIHVKGKADEVLDVVVTRHGPIITSLLPGETRPIALRWTLYEGARNPFFAVDTARNWDEFTAAFSQLDAPGQNVVYADVDGNIGYHTTGRYPIRAKGDGGLPEDGSNDEHEWNGYIPFDKLPSIYDPPSGIIATANARITPDKYPYSISTGWEAPWRTERIYQVLESGKKFTAADMLSLQTDTYSEFDQFAAQQFVAAVDRSAKASSRAKRAAEIMRGWDGRMSAESAAPTLAFRARAALIRLLLEPKLGAEPGISYSWGMQSVWLENVLHDRPRRWLPPQYAGYDDLLAAAVETVLSEPDAPANLDGWKWGEVNAVAIQHPVLGKIPLLNFWTGPGVRPQSGSAYAVKAVTREHGPSERMTDDLADLDASTLNVVTGQSGNFLSPYYMDQWTAWYGGSSFRLPYSTDAVKSATAHTLRLAPGR